MMKGTPVRIGVVYQPGKRAKPVWIELNRRQVRVNETTYYWRDRVGETPLIHYAVTTEETGDLYELIFNPLDESWSIHKHKTE